MTTFTTILEDHTGFLHTIEVDYTWIPPRPATRTDPEEGGVEILGVTCDTKKLSLKETELAERECVDAVWDTYLNGGH